VGKTASTTEGKDNARRLIVALLKLETFVSDGVYEGDLSLVREAIEELRVLRGRIKHV
jgi:hypothetical protein